MAPRKRSHDEMEAPEHPKEMSLLDKIRNMWEFAATMQYIFLFGKAVKIDDTFDIEVCVRSLQISRPDFPNSARAASWIRRFGSLAHAS